MHKQWMLKYYQYIIELIWYAVYVRTDKYDYTSNVAQPKYCEHI